MFRLLLILFIPVSGLAQQNIYKGMPSIIWPKLYDIRYEQAKDAYGNYDKPVFSAAAKSLAGKTVTLPGYIMPFEGSRKATHLMLSSLPLNACFFCGVGGPETAVEVFLTTAVTYTEKPVEVRGVLKLNDKDPDKMIYILENAEVLGEAGM
jgi:hypothetical protein